MKSLRLKEAIKISRIWQNKDSLLPLLCAMIAVVFVMAILAQIAQAGWDYKRPIQINNPGGTLNDYQVLVTLTTENFTYDLNKMKPDGGDIRFSVADNVSPLPYWMEEWNWNGTSKFWVKVPTIGTGSTTPFHMYYGNPSAISASNGDATFDIFEDFDKDDGEWTEYDPNNKIELDYTADQMLEFNNWIRSDQGYVYKSYSTQPRNLGPVLASQRCACYHHYL
jgi:hypothetical protein